MDIDHAVTATGNTATGEGYFRAITTLESDRQMRAAFQHLAEKLRTEGASVLDFGCGPGIDAKCFAERGFSVVGYDIDTEMRAFFKMHCAAEIQSKQVSLWECDYADLLNPKNAEFDGRFDLITANFAPLNLVADLPALFAKFFSLTKPNARILASVLNPYYAKEMRYRWRVRNQWRLWRHGWFDLQQLPGKVFRRHPHAIAAAGAPYFALENVFPGAPHASIDCYAPTATTHSMRALDWFALAKHMFIFVLLRRID